jgi:hypothetical protein
VLQIFDVRSQVISAGDMTDAVHQKDEDAEAEISSSFKRHQYSSSRDDPLSVSRQKKFDKGLIEMRRHNIMQKKEFTIKERP